jgi:hypothetical protein
METYDIILIGSGHNALITAAYVTRAIRPRCRTCICWVRQRGQVMALMVARGISSRSSCWRLEGKGRSHDNLNVTHARGIGHAAALRPLVMFQKWR